MRFYHPHYRVRRLLRHLARLFRLLTFVLGVLSLLMLAFSHATMQMPGDSFSGELPPLSWNQRQVAGILSAHVNMLCEEIGERNLLHHAELMRSAVYLEDQLAEFGYAPRRRAFRTAGPVCYNIIAEVTGEKRSREVIVITASYDSAPGSVGANSDAGGVASLLLMARRYRKSHPARTLRFVFLANENNPGAAANERGSTALAKMMQENAEIPVAILNMKSLGIYSEEPESQAYPFPLRFTHPNAGNFIAFIAPTANMGLVQEVIAYFRNSARFPSEGLVLADTTRADWALLSGFSAEKYPVLTISDTGPLRDPLYRTDADVPERLHFGHMARVLDGLHPVIDKLARFE